MAAVRSSGPAMVVPSKDTMTSFTRRPERRAGLPDSTEMIKAPAAGVRSSRPRNAGVTGPTVTPMYAELATGAGAGAVGAVLVRLRYGALNFDTVALSGGEHKLAYVVEAPPVFFSHSLLPLAATFIFGR